MSRELGGMASQLVGRTIELRPGQYRMAGGRMWTIEDGGTEYIRATVLRVTSAGMTVAQECLPDVPFYGVRADSVAAWVD
jgi:hypothetical protein